MDMLNILLLVLIVALAAYFVRFAGKHRRTVRMLRAIIDAHHTPVLYYDDRGRLAYINTQAETVFEQIPGDIQRFEFIERSSNPEGPHLHLSDRFGNGYRLEVTENTGPDLPGGKIVFVKGYAQVRPNPR